MQHPSESSENNPVFSSTTKASASNVLDDHEDIPSKKRKLNDVDMRPHKKSLLATFPLLYCVCADPCRCLGEVVTLLVGEDPESKDSKFIVHKNILCAASPFFEAACKQEWQGTEKDIIRLPEEQPEVIRTFVDEHIYLSLKDYDTREPADLPAGILVKLYVLGDKYQMPRLRNQVMDALTSYCFTGDGRSSLEVLDHACKNTAKGSALRKYLASTTVDYLYEEALYHMDEELYPELIHDIAMHLMRARDDKDEDPPLTFCDKYHIHGPEPRVLCKEGERNRGG
ncbi:hypothetical protein EAF04_008787 [Stromatinia cepivora]|nr:hypothetical protein EAF04_008787 [Stromatinia cepivora]